MNFQNGLISKTFDIFKDHQKPVIVSPPIQDATENSH